MWVIFQNGKTEYNYFNFISIIATPLFLIVKSILKYPFFPKSQQVIGTNRKYKKLFQNYSYICRCPGLSNGCTFGLANRLDGSFAPDTELELNMFRPFPFGQLVWNLRTQVNNGLLDAQITVFDPRSDKHSSFFPCLVYALVYPSISSNLVTVATLIPWSESVCTHICSPFSKKPLLR